MLINSLDRLTKAIKQRNAKLEELETERRELDDKSKRGLFCGAIIWLEEIDKLEEVIKEGRETRWLFNEFGKYKY